MVAPMWLLVLSVTLGGGVVALVGYVVSRLARRLHDAPVSPEAARGALWPMAALSLIALPYLPWLPDHLPFLTIFAGPARWLVWGVAVAETTWLLVHRVRSGHEGRLSRKLWLAPFPLAILIAGLLANGPGALKLTGSSLFPSGDEPHYLIIAQSLWRDGDLKIENNHRRGDYKEYFTGRALEPHMLARGVDGEIYSVHPVGLAVLLAPIYAVVGYRGASFVVLLMACVAAALMTTWVARVTGNRSAATFSWAALFLGAPLFYNAFTIYPEVPAALAVTMAFTLSWPALGRTAEGGEPLVSPGRALACGLAIAALPWLSTKYALMAGALGLVVLARVWWPLDRTARRSRISATLALAVPCLVSLSGWLLFFRLIWGRWSPTAPYGTQRETRLEYLPYGGPGLLFDQEYGVVAFAPILFLGLTGLVSLIRQGGDLRRLGIEIVAVFAALLGVVGAFHLWWGGSAPVGRPVVSALWLLALPIAWQYGRLAAEPLRHAAHRLLLWMSLGVTGTIAVAQQGLLLNAGRDGSSQLLEYLSPTWSLTAIVPTFIRSSVAEAWALTACWVAVALGAGWGLARMGRARVRAEYASLAALTTAAAAVMVLSWLVPIVGSRPVVRPAPTSFLDSFDRTARPWAIRYDPMRAIDAGELPSLFTLIAHRAGQQPHEGRLFGTRLSLPAGRYRVELRLRDLSVSEVEGELGLQLGRDGGPLERWKVRLTPAVSWQATFELPIDVNYLGFHASPPLERAAPDVRVTPLAIVDARSRQPRLDVASARAYGSTQIIAHDHRAWLEPDGLWVRGRADVPLTIWQPGSRRARLAVHARLVPTTVTVVTAATRERHTLGAGESIDTWIPLDARGVGRLRVTTSDGAVPATIWPGHKDTRFLGCWIETAS